MAKMRFRRAIDTFASLAVIAAAGSVVWTTWSPNRAPRPREVAVPSQPVPISESAVEGSPAARVALIVYSNFRCRYCRTFAVGTWPILRDKYVTTGQVIFIFKNLPVGADQASMAASRAAECARKEGVFWRAHDELFKKPLIEDDLDEWSVKIGANPRTLRDCFAATETTDRIRRDSAEAEHLGIRGTPTFLIGRIDEGRAVRVSKVISGARPVEDFVSAIDPLVRPKRASR